MTANRRILIQNSFMRGLTLICALLMASTVALSQHRTLKPAAKPLSPAADPFSASVFQNADVTARKLDIPAGASAPVSADLRDYLLISYGDNSLRVTGYQTDFRLSLADADIQVLQGGWPHKLTNESTHPAELLMVEVARNLFPKSARCGLGAKNCGETRFGQSGAGEYRQSTLFETDTANLFRATLGPGVAMHQHDDTRPHLIIALTPFQGHADDAIFTLQPRQVFWRDGSVQELGNDGSAQARFLILELKQKY
jgi:redox-sensitive bicupin YhaK (pirin superfamily)